MILWNGAIVEPNQAVLRQWRANPGILAVICVLLRCVIVCYAVVGCLGEGTAAAQSGSPLMGRPGALIEGGVGLRPAPGGTLLSGFEKARQHLSPIGKPCVAVTGQGQAQVINPHIFEHIITANNSCSQIIKLYVCYYGSERCVPMVVPSYTRKMAVLGIQPDTGSFRFEYWERFP